MDNIIEIKGLSKSFSVNQKGRDNVMYSLLSNLNIQIPRNKITALIGGNGTGKTTLFNIISGFIDLDEGDIFFFNDKSHKINDLPSYKREHLGIGRMFQDNHIFPTLSVIDNMLIASKSNLKNSSVEAIFKRKNVNLLEEELKVKAINIIITNLGKESFFLNNLNIPAGNLSYGQKRILGLLRLFMADYKLVMLDEPTTGINPEVYQTISGIIKNMVINQKMTVFLIEHNMEFVKRNADFCLFLNEGDIKIKGSPIEVLNNEIAQKNYLGA